MYKLNYIASSLSFASSKDKHLTGSSFRFVSSGIKDKRGHGRLIARLVTIEVEAAVGKGYPWTYLKFLHIGRPRGWNLSSGQCQWNATPTEKSNKCRHTTVPIDAIGVNYSRQALVEWSFPRARAFMYGSRKRPQWSVMWKYNCIIKKILWTNYWVLSL